MPTDENVRKPAPEFSGAGPFCLLERSAPGLCQREFREPGGSGGDVTSLSAQELPEAVREAIGRCASGQWYVLRHGGRQYVWYGGFAWSFGWQPGETEAGWRLDIVKFQRKDSGDLLLSLPEGALDIRVDGEAAVYTAVDCGG